MGLASLSSRELDSCVCDRASARSDARGRMVGGTPREVRTRTVEADLHFLNIVMNWATRWRMAGECLLSENAMRGFRIPSETIPRCPVIIHDRFLRARAQTSSRWGWRGTGRGRVGRPISVTCLTWPTGREDALARLGSCTHATFTAIGANMGRFGSPQTRTKMGREGVVYLPPPYGRPSPEPSKVSVVDHFNITAAPHPQARVCLQPSRPDPSILQPSRASSSGLPASSASRAVGRSYNS